jgi:hypothetical protein
VAFDYEKKRASTERTLIDFLHTELALGRTLAQSASLAQGEGHTDHYVQAKRNAAITAATIQRFIGQVADGAVKAEIGEGLAELDRLISTL